MEIYGVSLLSLSQRYEYWPKYLKLHLLELSNTHYRIYNSVSSKQQRKTTMATKEEIQL